MKYNIFHVTVELNLIVHNGIQTQNGIKIKVNVSVKLNIKHSIKIKREILAYMSASVVKLVRLKNFSKILLAGKVLLMTQ